ncbi:20015_t:CDS:2 [Dentiscutata erythropus]|uniref:Chitin synthase n=1 Tax=Dentiscutata erythropus TaxID=1348616 RepID=A0A9N9BCH5_9GLOM|nr:20015_t:CDS:2 [Dentiscutata erythropus]
MCNENESLLSQTFDGVIENILYLCTFKDSEKWAFLNPQVTGACGKIDIIKDRIRTNFPNLIMGAQNFKYKISDILNKPFESFFSHIASLPKNLYAYQYSALLDIKDDVSYQM